MKRQLSSNLLKWYDNEKISLPWRNSANAYHIFLSEVMLQQTQVNTVIPYFQRWIQAFPTIKDVAQAPLDHILKQWEGLGYYSRARNFHKSCQIICEKFSGEIPNNIEAISSLPGIGPYSAAAVMSIAFHHPLPAVDANVLRIVSRLHLLSAPVSTLTGKVASLLSEIIPKNRAGDFNQAMMDLGRVICTNRNPKCDICPLNICCKAYAKNLTHAFPKKNAKPLKPVYKIAVGVIWRDGDILISRRKEEGLLGGLWEFPGGKLLPGETAENCIVREVQEELGVVVQTTEFIKQIKHSYTHFSIIMDAYHCKYISGEPRCYQCSDWRWIEPEDISILPFPRANHKLFQHAFAKEELC
ncbi:MAG: A/G-specific adenine glycosylase [Candidatus Marinimicrobia bacterium]|nr:A/G-specific adenine glycosylase [Candidatus Neomarinimicrobiota bacterium]